MWANFSFRRRNVVLVGSLRNMNSSRGCWMGLGLECTDHALYFLPSAASRCHFIKEALKPQTDGPSLSPNLVVGLWCLFQVTVWILCPESLYTLY